MSSSTVQEEKNLEAIRELMELPPNKHCFDCGQKDPVWANCTIGTFVCTPCSDIHRELSHRCKSVSIPAFTEAEVEKLTAVGNENAAEEWHANWNPNNHPAPTGNDIGYIRTFLGWTYSECKFRAPPPPVVDTAEIEKLDQKVLERAAALQSLNAEETNVREQLRIGEYPSDPTLQLSQQQIATLHTRAQHLMREIADAFVLLQLAVEARSQAKLPSPLRM